MKDATVAGKRVFLRPPSKRDAKELITLNRESAAFHKGLVSPPTNPEQFANFIERCRRPDCSCFLICRVEDDAIVGAMNLSQIFLGGFRSAYLGYFVGAKYAGQGYMSEALELVLRYAFRRLKLHRIEANIQPGNVTSIALVERVCARDTPGALLESLRALARSRTLGDISRGLENKEHSPAAARNESSDAQMNAA